MKTGKRLEQSQRMKLANADKEKLKGPARAMYLEGKVRLANSVTVSQRANNGKGWNTPFTPAVEVKNEEEQISTVD